MTVNIDTNDKDIFHDLDVHWDIPFSIADNVVNPNEHYMIPSESNDSAQDFSQST